VRKSDRRLNAQGGLWARFASRRYIDRVAIVHIFIIRTVPVAS
jgi:hypothetical protein